MRLTPTPKRLALLKATAQTEVSLREDGRAVRSADGVDRVVTLAVGELEQAGWVVLTRRQTMAGRDYAPTELGYEVLAERVPGWTEAS